MYGLIGKKVATAGKREELISLLLQGTEEMPGCLSYVIAKDQADDDGIWITEVWDDKASHDASLSLPAVKKAIEAARPMIAAFNTPVVTTPVGGHGLPVAKHAKNSSPSSLRGLTGARRLESTTARCSFIK